MRPGKLHRHIGFAITFGLLLIYPGACIEPISGLVAGFAAVASLALSGYKLLNCQFNECCEEGWVSFNSTDLREKFNKELYGQHLVINTTIRHLKGHLNNKRPNKALSLSFHGWTGTGKNFVSKLMTKSIFRKGRRSNFVHLISATKEFPHQEMVPFYQDQLKNWIEGNVTICDRSVFIFDEMDKMPTGLIDTLKPYLDYYEELGGVDYRKSVFIFLSNTGGEDINTFVLNHYARGLEREKIKLSDLENILSKTALNSKSGMWHSSLITKHLVTAFIPFLPLERKHIKDCIRDSLVHKKHYSHKDQVDEDKVTEVADQLSYFPPGLDLFSITGCKRVHEKVDFIMENDD